MLENPTFKKRPECVMAGDSVEAKLFGLKLWQQVFIALILGITAGLYFGKDAEMFKILGTIFINLIKMVVVPLIFFALVSGITSMEDSHSFSRVGLKGLGAYFLTAMLAVCLGLLFGNLFNPGLGLTIDPSTLAEPTVPASAADSKTVSGFILGMIPTNALRAMTEDHFLQVVVFSIFTGVTMNLVADRCRHLRVMVYESAQVCFKMIEMIVRLAPLAVFGFISWSVGTLGMDVIKSLLQFVVAVIGACLVQYVFFGIMLMVLARLNPLKFYKKMFTTQLMAFSTSSSKATLTTAMRELQEKLGVSERSTNFLMPLGACINMDGTAIYLGLCAVFFSQIFGVHLGMHEYLVLIITCTFGSIGAAGIPSGSIIFMGMVLTSVNIPMGGIALILGVDRILDMVRTTINITGDATITTIVDASEKTLDRDTYNR
ncbi:cation:dicarboxylase symporter family transporter [bacterium]|nr:cation:dicarboxylase symporter family transporter [bacterium]